MIQIDWLVLGWGALVGAISTTLFFAGLAWSVRLALRAGRPATMLLISGAVRIAALLAVGWWITMWGGWAFAGFALAFLVTRSIILSFAKPVAPKGAIWN